MRLLGLLTVCCLSTIASAQSILHRVPGRSAGDLLGDRVAALADLNGDGVPDFAVSARQADPGGPSSGVVAVLSGADGTLLFEALGEGAGMQLGFALGPGGDVDGDGTPDVAIGAPFHDGQALNGGLVRVLSGVDGSVVLSSEGGTQFGHFGSAVCGLGDVTGDSLGDLLVGAPQEDGNGGDSGTFYVISGATGHGVQEHHGDALGDRLGHAVCALGDLDGDGRSDYCVSAPGNDVQGADAGMVRVYSGVNGAVLYTRHGDSAGDAFGHAVAGGLDLDGDGLGDLAVGAPQDDDGGPNSGSVRVFSGATGATIYTLHGQAPGDAFGHAVALVPDVDGDGLAEVLVGAPFSDLRAPSAGSAHLYSGATGTELTSHAGTQGGDQLGASVAGLADVTGDGRGEWLVGSPRVDFHASDAGRADLWTMDHSGPVNYCVLTPNSSGLPGRISWHGSTSIGANRFALVARDLPPQQSGLFIYGLQPIQLPLGDGTACVGSGGLGFVLRLPAGIADRGGRLAHTLDLTSPPAPQGMVTPGSTWVFQCWFRDLPAGGAGFNFTDGLEATFAP